MNIVSQPVSKFMYIGSIVHSLSLNNLEIITNGIIVIVNGKIVHISKDASMLDIKKKFEIGNENVYVLEKGQFIIPGFIDTHIHAPQYPNIGLGYEKTLLDWLNIYTFPLEKKFVDCNYAEMVYEAVVKKTVENGTTTACYFATLHKSSSVILAKMAQKFGQRALIGKVNMIDNAPEDYCESFMESLTNTRLFIEEINSLNDELVTPVITPRFALSCDMEFMQCLSSLAEEYNIPIQTHLSENVEEMDKVKEMYPKCLHYTDVYDKAGLITEKTILAHGVYLKPEEIAILKSKKAAISHCPSSNNLLQSGLCPVRQLLKSGLKISLGTDCSGGSSCSMMHVMREALQTSIHAQFQGLGEKLSCAEVFYLATLGGAEALSIANKTGNFSVGKDFDAIVVNMRDDPSVHLLETYTEEELFQKFFYLADDRMLSKVYVAGKLIKNM